jgi:hypothetical protein
MVMKTYLALLTAVALAACGGGGGGGGSGSLCADGTTTQSAGKQGACSHHGGLATSSSSSGSPSTNASDTTSSSPASTTPTVAASTSPEGLYVGQSSVRETIRALVNADGSFYFVLKTNGSVSGAVVGTANMSNGTFSSPNVVDYVIGSAPAATISMSASYSQKVSLNGGFTTPKSYETFTANYDTAYDSISIPVDLAGLYFGSSSTLAGTQSGSLTIQNGALTGVAGGCGFQGNLVQLHGPTFRANATFSTQPGSACSVSGQSFSGVAIYDASLREIQLVLPRIGGGDIALIVARQ